MPQGANRKRERESAAAEREEQERKFEREGRHPGRQQEVATRIVNGPPTAVGETEAGTGTAQRPGRGGTGHRRRNTARRNKPS